MNLVFNAPVENGVGKARRVTYQGRDYLAAPVVLVVPGVLPGSKGPLMYRPEDVRASVKDWQGMPLTADHPYDPMTNEHLSASHEGVLQRQGIGTLRNVTYDGRLRGEAWVDIEHANRVNPDIVKSMREGRPLEVSTGLYTNNVPSPQGSSHVGRPYSHFATDFVPDHLAILPSGTIGACSLSDGCGLMVNANPEGHNQYGSGSGGSEKPRRPNYVGAKSKAERDKIKADFDKAEALRTGGSAAKSSLASSQGTSSGGGVPAARQSSTSSLTTDHVLQAVKDIGGPYNHTKLADLREHPLLKDHSREHQDRAIHQARREGKVTAGAAEGRHGSTERERKAYINDDGDVLGHLMVKNSQTPNIVELRLNALDDYLTANNIFLVTNANPRHDAQQRDSDGQFAFAGSGKGKGEVHESAKSGHETLKTDKDRHDTDDKKAGKPGADKNGNGDNKSSVGGFTEASDNPNLPNPGHFSSDEKEDKEIKAEARLRALGAYNSYMESVMNSKSYQCKGCGDCHDTPEMADNCCGAGHITLRSKGVKNSSPSTAFSFQENRDWPQKKRDNLDDSDFAGPNQSFPITTQADVDAAAHLVGKAKDPDAVKSRIKTIAKRKGLTLPESWKSETTENEDGEDVTTANSSLPGNREIGPTAVPNQPLTGDPTRIHDMGLDGVSMSKQAAGATVMCKPGKAVEHAMTAVQAAHEPDPDAASDAHAKAALAHDRQAGKELGNGDSQEADLNHQAADMHRRAGAMHKVGGMVGNKHQETDDGVNGMTANKREEWKGLLENFNPFHDEQGRFSSGGSKGIEGTKSANKSTERAMKVNTSLTHQAAADAHAKASTIHALKGNKKAADMHAEAAGKHQREADAISAGLDADNASHNATKGQTIASRRGGHAEAAEAHKTAALLHKEAGNSDKAAEHSAKAEKHSAKSKSGQTMNKKKFISKLIANKCACEADRIHLNSLSDPILKSLATNAPFMKKGMRDDRDQEDDDEDDDEDDSEMEDDENDRRMQRNDEDNTDHSFDTAKPQKGGSIQAGGKGVESEYTDNANSPVRKRMTAQEQEVWNTAQETWRAQKLQVVRQLVANVANDEERKAMGAKFMQKPIAELREMLKLLPPQRVDNFNPAPRYTEPLYQGAAGAGSVNGLTDNAADDDEPLDIPVLNYAEIAKENAENSRRRRAN